MLREIAFKQSSNDIILNTGSVRVRQEQEDVLEKRQREESGPCVTRPLWEWVTPRNPKEMPAITITPRQGIRINKFALGLGLLRDPFVRVGVSVTGELAIAPVEKAGINTYKVSYDRSGGRFGGTYLSSWLLERGIKPGVYEVEKDKRSGWLVAKFK